MNVLLIGSGGREHALAWKLAQSSRLGHLFVTPGNAGIAEVAEIVLVGADDHDGVIEFCREQAIDLVVVGPEAPLVAGLADALRDAGIAVFGPGREAAQLEGSKGFTKDLCARYDIPTAAYGRFSDAASAKAYLARQSVPIVIKADGLAAGKGVTVAATMAEAEAAVDACFDGAFGAAGAEVVIEAFLKGEEASFFALTDGTTVLPFGTAQDHKQVGDGDTGPNTGGMGAYSPAPVLDDALCQTVMERIIVPTVRALKDQGLTYRGVLYAGLMITESGPQLIEYNIRFGDPECQVLMLRLENDLLPVLHAAATGQLANHAIAWSDDKALTVVMAATGYPGSYDKGTRIGNLAPAVADDAVTIFHAGTKADGDQVVANGGRVLNVCATGPTVGAARDLAYQAVDRIDWPDGFCRRDIGHRAIARERHGA